MVRFQLLDDRSGLVISALGWILIGVAAWLVVAVAVGITIGRTIRLRDRQVGEETADPSTSAPDIPAQTADDRGRPRT
jgi:hypothetical protein